MCEQSVLGVGLVFEDGGSSPVDSAVVDALQRGQWSPGDLLSSLYHSLQVSKVLLDHMVMQLVKMLLTMQL